MKTFRVILLVIGMHAITAYGSDNDRNCYGGIVSGSHAYLQKIAYLERMDARMCEGKSIEELQQFQQAAFHTMIFGEENEAIFSPRKNNQVIVVGNKPENSTPCITPVASPIVTNARKRATCISRLKDVFARNHRVYVTAGDDLR